MTSLVAVGEDQTCEIFQLISSALGNSDPQDIVNMGRLLRMILTHREGNPDLYNLRFLLSEVELFERVYISTLPNGAENPLYQVARNLPAEELGDHFESIGLDIEREVKQLSPDQRAVIQAML